jgi:hypothetical protein
MAQIAASDYCTGQIPTKDAPEGWLLEFDIYIRSGDWCARALERRYENRGRRSAAVGRYVVPCPHDSACASTRACCARQDRDRAQQGAA